jgi:hypothetical protein
MMILVKEGKERNKAILNKTLAPFVFSIIMPTAFHPRNVMYRGHNSLYLGKSYRRRVHTGGIPQNYLRRKED